MNNTEFQNLIANISKFLHLIQNSFDEYQKKHFRTRSPQFFCLELNGEVGELANLEKKLWKGKEVNTDKLAEETADALIALMNYSNSRNLNLTTALINKLEWIEATRKKLQEEGSEY
ncbi:MAG: hypothetical protein ACUVQ1_06045 [Candidatus Kapaibacteriales bacterium]